MRSKTFRVFVNIAQVLTLCSAAVVSTSYALERHIHAGSACVPQFNNYVYKRDTSGIVRNTSNSDQVWECPIMRRTNNALSRVGVRVNNFGTNGNNIVCALRSRWNTGATYQTIIRTAASGTGYVIFDNGIQVKSFGAISLRCKLPKKNGNNSSAIVNYFTEY